MVDALLGDHAIDVELRCGLVRNVIEHEDLPSVGGLDHQLVFVLVGEVDALGELAVWVFGFKPDHHFHLLLPVYSTAPTHHKSNHRLPINHVGAPPSIIIPN
jgi:hypothetical protein